MEPKHVESERPTSNTPLPRSPLLLAADDSALLIVDVQDKLVRLIPEHPRLIWNLGRLLDAAAALHVHVAATEQNPARLGRTVTELAARLPLPEGKQAFSCGACGSVFAEIRRRELAKLIVVGIETHVCIQQTVCDALAGGWLVYVAVDAVGSRNAVDHTTALRRMESCGATLTTTESVLFEWCQTADRPEFKRISELVRQSPPA